VHVPHLSGATIRSNCPLGAAILGRMTQFGIPAPQSASPDLVPELLVTDLDASLAFWVDLCGFTILYERPSERFAYLRSGSAELMLEQVGTGRNWIPAELDRPLGRGVNFQIMVPAIQTLLDSLSKAAWPLFMAAESKWYDTGDTRVGIAQFLVQDPDGYLVRFSSRLGADA
jgi:catechol 2,3-dioxygenase-like lactoylglutathione lyase family enzyme